MNVRPLLTAQFLSRGRICLEAEMSKSGDSSPKRRCPYCPARVRVSYLSTHIDIKHVNDQKWAGGPQRWDIPTITGLLEDERGILIAIVKEPEEPEKS
jgi:hypothetical protein